jgi:predicted molibdopterin-dependent oxidoreductase YjgC
LRILKHPILGPLKKKKEVTISVDEKTIKAIEGEPIASALIAMGIINFRTTIKKESPRGYFCGIGKCTDCMMIVNGVRNVRTCITPVKEGMRIETQIGLESSKTNDNN